MPALAWDAQCILLAFQRSCLYGWAILSRSNTLRSKAGPWKGPFCLRSFHYNVDDKKKKIIDPVWGHYPCEVYTFSSCLRGFFPGTSVFSHIPKMCMWDELACLHHPRLGECGCVWVVLSWNGVLSRVGFWAARMGSGHLWPWTGISKLKNKDLFVFINFS